MEWSEIVPYLFGFMALAIAGWVASSIRDMSQAIGEMRDSVAELNKNMAVAIFQLNDHDKRLTKLEDRDE